IAAFLPVPFTLIIYNKLMAKKGFGFAYRYTLVVFAAGMISMFAVSFMPIGTVRTVLSIVTGLICSFAVGSMFAVAYSVPSQLAAEEEKRTGISNSAMYFAVQGLFSGVATGIGTGLVPTALKGTEDNPSDGMRYLTLIAGIGSLVAFVLTAILPKSITSMGKEKKD
ncbi:MAG: hypothetical protein ACI3XQ_11810, partial [Eubacteriales bacterium]